jgi:predicted transcriptional regulator
MQPLETLSSGSLRQMRSTMPVVTPAEDPAGNFLGPLESEVMHAVWRAVGPISVREVVDELNDGRGQQLAYTTVMTVMSRLAEKDMLKRRHEGRGYVYEATAEDTAGLAVRGVIRDFGDAAMAQFLEEAKADPQVLRRLRRIMREES